MNLSPRFWPIFFEVYEHLPRQGPGTRASTAKALKMCRGLPSAPAICDLGCGIGAQTLDLAELTSGTITAIDLHAPFIQNLQTKVERRGLADRVKAQVGDMSQPDFPPGAFDLIWSEGALYNIAIREALHVCRGLLRPGGYLAFTDAVWRKANPPPAIKAGFDQDYPTMGRVQDVLGTIVETGFELVGHFTLPDEAWWTNFYTPMEERIEELCAQYAQDDEATAICNQLAEEPRLHRQYGAYYAYEFFVTRWTGACA